MRHANMHNMHHSMNHCSTWKSTTMDNSTSSTQEGESYFEDPVLITMICGGRDCLQQIGNTFPYTTPFPSTDDDDDNDDNDNDNDNIMARRSRRPEFWTKRFPPAHYHCKEDETQPTHKQDTRTACTYFIAPPMFIKLWKWLKKRHCFGYCTHHETKKPTISYSCKSSSHQNVCISVHRQSFTSPQGEVIAY